MFLLAAVAVMTAANAQVVVGIQGGYHYQKLTQSYNTENYTLGTNWLGGLQVGYKITPRLYVGVSGNYQNFTTDTFYLHSTEMYNGPGIVVDMPRVVDNRQLIWNQTCWTVSPQVKWEFLKYGNMHFHLLLQGSYTQRGYMMGNERYNTPFLNNGEYLEFDYKDYGNMCDSTRSVSWGVSLRPTLTYEFSEHLSAELSLDFLSVGYIDHREYDDHMVPKYDNDYELEYLDGDIVYTGTVHKVQTIYGGLNTLMELLRWESPMLRLGFNWTF